MKVDVKDLNIGDKFYFFGNAWTLVSVPGDWVECYGKHLGIGEYRAVDQKDGRYGAFFKGEKVELIKPERKESDMTKIYYAPAWAISLKDTYKYFNEAKREKEAYGVVHSGRLSLDNNLGSNAIDSVAFFEDYNKAEYRESETFKVETKREVPAYGDAKQECCGPFGTEFRFDQKGDGWINVYYVSPYWNAEALRYLSKWASDAADALESK